MTPLPHGGNFFEHGMNNVDETGYVLGGRWVMQDSNFFFFTVKVKIKVTGVQNFWSNAPRLAATGWTEANDGFDIMCRRDISLSVTESEFSISSQDPGHMTVIIIMQCWWNLVRG